MTEKNAGAKPATSRPEKQSLWRSTADIWPFLLGMFLCGLASYFLTFAGSAYVQPNSLTTAATVTLLSSGACVIATAFGLLHLGFHCSARAAWGIGAIASGILTVAAFFVGGRVLSPGFVFCLILVFLCLPGFGLGRLSDEYRSQFPDRPKFLGDWE